MSLARRHRDRILAAQTVASAPDGGVAAAPVAAPLPATGAAKAAQADIAARQIGLRMTHDLRRLKEIRSIDAKVAAKREMLPEYRAWVMGILSADADVGSYDDAISLAEFLLRHKVAMPSRYQRDAATILIEEIADAAIKAQGANESFSLATLEDVADLTGHLDIHDQVRAKLMKAIGVEMLDRGADMAAEDGQPMLQQALAALTEAQRLHDRIGVKDKIKRVNKLLASIPATPDPHTEPGGDSAA